MTSDSKSQHTVTQSLPLEATAFGELEFMLRTGSEQPLSRFHSRCIHLEEH